MINSAVNTVICPTCGCSLIRLGIVKSRASRREYRGKEYLFCCEGCASLFDEDPVAALKETGSLVVCPSCLAEKSIEHTVEIEHLGRSIAFCRCPHCVNVFLEDPNYYLDRLAEKTGFLGIFSTTQGCCGESQPKETGKGDPA